MNIIKRPIDCVSHVEMPITKKQKSMALFDLLPDDLTSKILSYASSSSARLVSKKIAKISAQQAKIEIIQKVVTGSFD